MIVRFEQLFYRKQFKIITIYNCYKKILPFYNLCPYSTSDLKSLRRCLAVSTCPSHFHYFLGICNLFSFLLWLLKTRKFICLFLTLSIMKVIKILIMAVVYLSCSIHVWVANLCDIHSHCVFGKYTWRNTSVTVSSHIRCPISVYGATSPHSNIMSWLYWMHT